MTNVRFWMCLDLPESLKHRTAHRRHIDHESRTCLQPYCGEPEFLTEVEMQFRERNNLLAVLETTRWKIKGMNGTAELLGVKPTTLKARMKKMGLKRPN